MGSSRRIVMAGVVILGSLLLVTWWRTWVASSSASFCTTTPLSTGQQDCQLDGQPASRWAGPGSVLCDQLQQSTPKLASSLLARRVVSLAMVGARATDP